MLTGKCLKVGTKTEVSGSSVKFGTYGTVDKVIIYKNKENSFLIITHYQRLLDYIKPDYIHVLSAGKIIKTGNADLGVQLEKTGYANLG